MKRVTIKIGSSFFIDKHGDINRDKMRLLIEQIKTIKNCGIDVCLVTSGAVAVGTKKMNVSKPHDTAKKQALAAIGQMTLMQEYEIIFDKYNLKCAQILVSHDDFGNRNRVNCLAKTLETLFEYGVIPVVNENDAVATEEIKVGDNDTLSAMISLLIDSDLLILVSDVDGLYTANPNTDTNAKLIPLVEKIDDKIRALAKAPSSEFGTGGMQTKLNAALITTNAGIPMVIMNATEITSLAEVVGGKSIGTYFKESKLPQQLKKCWLNFCANIEGTLVVDDGAKAAVIKRKSLLSCGITTLSGQFDAGQVVSINDKDGVAIAKGICNYDSTQLKTILKETASAHLVVHANNLAVISDSND